MNAKYHLISAGILLAIFTLCGCNRQSAGDENTTTMSPPTIATNSSDSKTPGDGMMMNMTGTKTNMNTMMNGMTNSMATMKTNMNNVTTNAGGMK